MGGLHQTKKKNLLIGNKSQNTPVSIVYKKYEANKKTG
jgi:hypothetical protein